MKHLRILVLILCACFVSVTWGQPLTCKAYTPWAQFHRANTQRFNPCEKVLNVHNVEGLSLKWSYTTGGGVVGAANGVVYVGSNDHNQYALNASTGAPLWSYATGDVGTSPTVANGVVYVSPYSDWYSNLYALNASTGAELWSYSDRGFLSSPAVANGVVYIGSWDHKVYALNAKTGKKLWSYTTGSSVDSSPAVANGVVYFSPSNGGVYAFGLK